MGPLTGQGATDQEHGEHSKFQRTLQARFVILINEFRTVIGQILITQTTAECICLNGSNPEFHQKW